jgi:hypothetical protein
MPAAPSKRNMGSKAHCTRESQRRGIGRSHVTDPVLASAGVFAIGIEYAPDVAVKDGRSAVLNGVSENPRGYSDPNPEGEPLQKDSRKNGNGRRCGFGARRLIVLFGRRRAKLPPVSGESLWHIPFARPVF